MRVFILDKPGKCLDQMLDWLSDYVGMSGVFVFEDDIYFVEQVGNYNPDICIIRAGRDGLNGLRVAEMVKQINPNTDIVIISETKDYAIEAYEIGVQGYLLCPLDQKKFLITISGSRGLHNLI